MTWPTLTIGRLTLREKFDLDANVNTATDKRTLGLKGEESYPPLPSLASLKARQEDFLGLLNRFVPIVFGNKSDHDGWYIITDVNTSLINYGDEVSKFGWSLQAEYVGPANAVDIESRMAYVARVNDFGLSGERWHAPAGGATAYWTGSNQASATVNRPTVDGAPVTVYRAVPDAVSPRWYSTLTGYQIGRARVLVSTAGEWAERTATNLTVPASGWVLTNGLVSVSAAPTATLQFAVWDGAQWDTKLFNVSAAGSATDLGVFDAATVIRNDYEACTVRLLKTKTLGRSQLDLTLRRGSLFVEGYLETDTSATSLDFFFGAVLAGGSASASNAATALRDQFLSYSAESVIGVRR